MWIKKTKFIRKILGVKKTGYYGRLAPNGVAGYDGLVEYASRNTSAHKSEIRLGLDLCMEAAADLIVQGVVIDLGPLGRLYPAVTSKWEEDPDDLSLSDMKLKINYKPADKLAGALAGVTLHWKNSNTADSSTSEAPNDESDLIIDDTATTDTSTGTTDSSTGGNTNDDGDGLGG